MTYTIIIILIALLIVCGIAATAIQQFNERRANQKREELSRQRVIYEETEESIAAASQMPVSQLLIALLRKRSVNALKTMYTHNQNVDVKNKIDEIQKIIASIDISKAAPDQNAFVLPATDKVIIKYIQGVKKLRGILRAEYSKAHVTSQVFAQEETALCSLQLRINVETLAKRAKDAVDKDMQGSARQYIEKAIAALTKHKPQNEYTAQRKTDLEDMLNGLEMNVKDNNLKKILADKENESEEIDALFAPKKKW